MAIALRADRHGVSALDMTFLHVRESSRRVEADGTRSHVESWMTGRTSAGGREADGVTRLTGSFSGPRYRRTQICDSGPVHWHVERRS